MCTSSASAKGSILRQQCRKQALLVDFHAMPFTVIVLISSVSRSRARQKKSVHTFDAVADIRHATAENLSSSLSFACVCRAESWRNFLFWSSLRLSMKHQHAESRSVSRVSHCRLQTSSGVPFVLLPLSAPSINHRRVRRRGESQRNRQRQVDPFIATDLPVKSLLQWIARCDAQRSALCNFAVVQQEVPQLQQR